MAVKCYAKANDIGGGVSGVVVTQVNADADRLAT
jgi:hypothetical protein